MELLEETQQRERVIGEARSWIGTPYHHQGRVKSAGVDCGMFLIEVFARAGVIESFQPAHYPQDWHLHRDEQRYLETILQFAREIPGPPRMGDVALFQFGRSFSHGAIVLEWPLVIHSYINRGVEYADVTKDIHFLGRPIKYLTANQWSNP